MNSEAWRNFTDVIKSPETSKEYQRAVKSFLTKQGLTDVQFVDKARTNPKWATDIITDIIRVQKARVERKEIAPASVNNYTTPLRLFLTQNDAILNWDKLNAMLPRARKYGFDRAPSLEEVRSLVENGDERLKAAVLIMASSGIRVGAWPLLKWKHIIPRENSDKILAAKVIVYAEEPEQYFSFITPEAYEALKNYITLREKMGEEITPDSPLIRDLVGTHGQGQPRKPKPLKVIGVMHFIERAWWRRRIRVEKKRRHDFKAVHGFRKFFKTQAEQVMRPINVEILMGHGVGVSSSYYKPRESELLEDYLKAIPHLSIGESYRFRDEFSEREKRIKTEFEERLAKIEDEIRYWKIHGSIVEAPQLRPPISEGRS